MFVLLATLTDESDKDFILGLYRNHYALVRQVIYGITRDRDDLEDLINDSYIRLIKNVSTLQALDCHKTVAYLVYTARSVAINYSSHRGVQGKHLYYGQDADIGDTVVDLGAAVEEIIVYRENVEELYQGLARLPESYRDVLYFRYILGMTDAEIAEKLDITTVSVRQYLARARRVARQRMQEVKIDA